ncbi:MAG: DUF5719 family protein [Micrococcales bacterium]|nr:DUF5719 family protein [Micrococcales bacterium]
MSGPAAPARSPAPLRERSRPPAGPVWLRSAVARVGPAVALVVALAVVVVVGSRQTSAGTDRPVPLVTVPPAATVLTCPGALELPAEVGGGGDSAFSPVPVAPVTRLTAVASDTADTAEVLGLDGAVVASGLVPGGTGSSVGAVTLDVTAAGMVRATPVAGATSHDKTWLAAATTMVTVTAGDLRGLAGASCQSATADQWLVGGSTGDGATAHLVLVNPGSTPARVSWTAWGAAGPVDLTSDQVLVAPRSVEVVNLGAAAGMQQALVTHVVASGGQVWAHVQDSAIDGYTAAGTDLVVAGAPPATRQTVPGLLVEEDGSGLERGGPTLRLLAPGDTGTTARLALFGSDGPVDLPGIASVTLTAGTVLDVPLSGLPADRYTAVVEADVPVVAAATFSRVGLPGELDPVPRVERALAASTLGGTGTVALPGDLTATLVVGAVGAVGAAAQGAGDGAVEVIGTGGQVLASDRLGVDAGTTGAWPVAGLVPDVPASDIAAVRVVSVSGATLVWAVVVETVQDDGTLVSVLVPTPSSGGPVVVAVRDDPALGQG